jgi:hypothetical protein
MFFRPLVPGFVKPRISGATALALILTLLGTFYLGILPDRLFKSMGREMNNPQNQTQLINR